MSFTSYSHRVSHRLPPFSDAKLSSNSGQYTIRLFLSFSERTIVKSFHAVINTRRAMTSDGIVMSRNYSDNKMPLQDLVNISRSVFSPSRTVRSLSSIYPVQPNNNLMCQLFVTTIRQADKSLTCQASHPDDHLCQSSINCLIRCLAHHQKAASQNHLSLRTKPTGASNPG